MRRTRIFICLLIIGFPLFARGAAAEIPVEEIVRKANLAAYYPGNDGLSDVKMTITDSQGRQRIRELRILRLNIEQGGEQKYYVYFHKPADVARMVFMVWKHLGQDDDRWLYLPALDLVRRIAAGDKRSSFAGSHFVYEDVSGRGLDEDAHEFVGEENGFYKIRNTPKQVKGVEFKYYYVWVDQKNFLPVKAEYFNVQDRLIRQVEAVEIKDINGYPTVTKSVARDLERKGETLIEFSNIQYDGGLTDDIFAERYLRQPPMKWIQ